MRTPHQLSQVASNTRLRIGGGQNQVRLPSVTQSLVGLVLRQTSNCQRIAIWAATILQCRCQL